MTRASRILAVGGAFFEAPMVAHVLELAGGGRPRVAFLPTARGDAREIVVAFYEAFAPRAEATHVELFGVPRPGLREHLLAQDAIVVSGGNTASMLAVWRAHGVDAVVREAWEAGVLLAGWSAGMICWFEEAVTDSFGEELDRLDCLGFLPGSACPHYDGEPRRRGRYHELILRGMRPGYAADDGVGLLFEGTALVGAVSARAGARAYRVGLSGAVVREEPLEPGVLVAEPNAPHDR